jgi:hypothetical protein
VVRFIDVDPKEIPNLREGRRGKVSYPILKSFLETNKVLVMMDRAGMKQSVQSLTMALNTYIRNHDLPIKIFQRSGELYLMRTDVDDNGDLINKDYKVGDPVEGVDEEAEDIVDLTDEEVAANYR